jgi:hypothetical protein
MGSNLIGGYFKEGKGSSCLRRKKKTNPHSTRPLNLKKVCFHPYSMAMAISSHSHFLSDVVVASLGGEAAAVAAAVPRPPSPMKKPPTMQQ